MIDLALNYGFNIVILVQIEHVLRYFIEFKKRITIITLVGKAVWLYESKHLDIENQNLSS
jgi:hypothetical protein